jgi:pectinesterase
MPMRTRPPLSLAALAGALALVPALAAQGPDASRKDILSLRVENPLALARTDETIAVRWADVRRILAAATPERVRVLDVNGAEITSQVVDNDGDGTLDELLFQGDFAPRETKRFAIEPAAPTRKYAARVDARYDPPRDDMAWESDRVGFRIYGQGLWKNPQYDPLHSSGIDVWVKRTRALIVEKWYTKGHDEYHLDKGEGADFYDVGPTLGTGGTAIWKNDTLYRAENFTTYRIIADGPIRAIFELKYEPWNAGGTQVSETKRIAIDAGQNLYKQEVIYAAPSEVTFVTGVVKRPGLVGITSKAQPWAWLTGWGPVVPKNGGHGEMGNAVMLPRDRVLDWKEAHNHFLAVSRATPGRPAVIWVGAGWTASGDFPTPQSWWTYLDTFAQRLASPVKVTIL